ncbi:hypothetical protein ILUMI_20274 [Ignelater luminosus]|uniref:Uncharacterized protein n=1 Tax=Ignelater luminosus TaxID=2038154 RepID=A0A8K0G4Q4_IGNLU|nr:hypothetical protein ILUMI_20274 [Ignelater luminosus]
MLRHAIWAVVYNRYFFFEIYVLKTSEDQLLRLLILHPILLPFQSVTAFLAIFLGFQSSSSVDRLSKFDYGEKENVRRYGQSIPPEYNLTKVTTPVAISYGTNDVFVAPEVKIPFYLLVYSTCLNFSFICKTLLGQRPNCKK